MDWLDFKVTLKKHKLFENRCAIFHVQKVCIFFDNCFSLQLLFPRLVLFRHFTLINISLFDVCVFFFFIVSYVRRSFVTLTVHTFLSYFYVFLFSYLYICLEVEKGSEKNEYNRAKNKTKLQDKWWTVTWQKINVIPFERTKTIQIQRSTMLYPCACEFGSVNFVRKKKKEWPGEPVCQVEKQQPWNLILVPETRLINDCFRKENEKRFTYETNENQQHHSSSIGLKKNYFNISQNEWKSMLDQKSTKYN